MHVQISRRLPARLNESRHSSKLHLRCEASRSRTEPRTNRLPRSRLAVLARSPLPPLRSGAALRSPTCSGPRPSTTSPGRKRNKWVPGCTPACSRSAGSLFLTRLIFRNSWFISFGSHGVASAHPSRERLHPSATRFPSHPKHEGTVEALAPAAELNETAVVDQAVAHRGSGGCAPRGTARGTTDPARHP